MFDRPEPGSALHRLRDGELCIITLPDETEVEAEWSTKTYRFFYRDKDGPTSKHHSEVFWRPAGVRF